MVDDSAIGNYSGAMTKQLMIMAPDEFRSIRKKLGWTQAEIAGRFNVNQSTIVRWTNGEREITGPAVILARLYASQHEEGKKTPQ